MIHRFSRWLGLAMTSWATIAVAQGGPPMLTDDPGTPARGEWEINLAWTVAHTSRESSHEAPLLDVNYGLRDNLQLNYEVAWRVLRDAESGSRSGAGNSLLGVKWRFFDGGEDGWQISAHPQLELRNPGSHSVERGVAEPGTGVLLPFQFRKGLGPFDVDFELGRSWRSDGEGGWSGGIVVGRPLGRKLECMLELHGEALAGFDRSTVVVDAGARWSVGERGALLASVGRDVRNDLQERATVFGYVGWQLSLR